MDNPAQVGGDHYKTPIEPIEYIMDNEMAFSEGNVIKYISRHKSKHGQQDVMKAIHYCLFILKHDYEAIDQETINAVLANLDIK